jgi:hypothetical protein
VTLSPISAVREHYRAFIFVGKVLYHSGGNLVATIVDDDYLGGEVEPSPKLPQMLERSAELVPAIPSGDDYGDMRLEGALRCGPMQRALRRGPEARLKMTFNKCHRVCVFTRFLGGGASLKEVF